MAKYYICIQCFGIKIKKNVSAKSCDIFADGECIQYLYVFSANGHKNLFEKRIWKK